MLQPAEGAHPLSDGITEALVFKIDEADGGGNRERTVRVDESGSVRRQTGGGKGILLKRQNPGQTVVYPVAQIENEGACIRINSHMISGETGKADGVMTHPGGELGETLIGMFAETQTAEELPELTIRVGDAGTVRSHLPEFIRREQLTAQHGLGKAQHVLLCAEQSGMTAAVKAGGLQKRCLGIVDNARLSI